MSRPALFRPRQSLCLLLLAMALAMRALLPGGLMLSAERGDITIALCNSDMMLAIPMKDAPPSPDDLQDDGEPCAFAGLGAADLPPSPFVPLPAVAAAAWDATRATALSPDSPRLLPPATGPPVTA